jgi:predicted ester cyclase
MGREVVAMSSDENKALARRFFELMEQRDSNLTQMRELFAPAFVVHIAGQPQTDVEGFDGFTRTFFAAFPDIHHVVEDQVAEGDRIGSYLTIRGTHQGDHEHTLQGPAGRVFGYEYGPDSRWQASGEAHHLRCAGHDAAARRHSPTEAG